MRVKDNLLVIRMDVAGLTQWGTSWPRERVPVKTAGMQKPQFAGGVGRPGKDNRDAKTADSKELWKSVEKVKVEGG
jgi:hypothetical protein